ncbi:MAG: NAD-dependent epimerase/dehydratase family protein, partial [Dehalococcoidia bacterium]
MIGGTGPTGPFVVEGLLKMGFEVAILHRGSHEVTFSQTVEHLHGDPHFEETLATALGDRKFDLVVGMYGRLRHVAQVLKSHTQRFIAVGGLPYRALVEGDRDPEGVPVPLPETAPLFQDEERNRFTFLMALSERVVMEAHEQGHYRATIMRFPLIYGPRQLAPPEWSIIRRILDGRKQLMVPDGGLRLERRGYAENMARAIMLAAEQPEVSGGQIYNVADETILSLRDWIDTIAKALGHQWELVSLPFWLARPSRPYAGRSHHRVLDISKVVAHLGYTDAVPTREAIRRTVEWYVEHRPQPGDEVEKQ